MEAFLFIDKFIQYVLEEDLGRGDLFSKIVTPTFARGFIIAKSDGIFAGEKYVQRIAELKNIEINFLIHDGETFKTNDKILTLNGSSDKLMSLERIILNIVLHASSIATLTNKYYQKIEKYGTKLLDTRKTRPLLRELEKYATQLGGATNHRMGLDDSLMLKDTHLKTLTNLDDFLKEARKKIPFTTKIEVEAETVEFAKKMLKKDIDILMCDNMSCDEVSEIVKIRNSLNSSILLEASGNITLENIEDYAKTGVDAISTGSIIHQANWLDLSMKIE